MAPLAQPKRVNWPLFFAILLAPAVCCFVAGTSWLAPLFWFFGSLIAGMICTEMLMKSVEETGVGRVMSVEETGLGRALFRFMITVLLCGLSLFLSYLGCTTAPNGSLP
jgi:hypothetical protein